MSEGGFGIYNGQIWEKEGRFTDVLAACVEGGSNIVCLFYDYIGREVAGRGMDTVQNEATVTDGKAGLFRGIDLSGRGVEDVSAIARYRRVDICE
jgi:tryptophan synthase beta subunit